MIAVYAQEVRMVQFKASCVSSNFFNLDECDNVYHLWLRSAFRPRQERVRFRSVLGPLVRALACCLHWCWLRLPDACP
jgi:hypothetical protein